MQRRFVSLMVPALLMILLLAAAISASLLTSDGFVDACDGRAVETKLVAGPLPDPLSASLRENHARQIELELRIRKFVRTAATIAELDGHPSDEYPAAEGIDTSSDELRPVQVRFCIWLI